MSKKKLISVLEVLPWDAWVTHWYDVPVLEGRRASFMYRGIIPYTEQRKTAQKVLKSLTKEIEFLSDDQFNGHWNIEVSTNTGVTACFYLGGPGSQPPPPPPPPGGDD